MTLSSLRTKLPCPVSLHIRAHQDGHCEFNLLPRPAQLNILADEVGSEVLADLRAADQPTEFYPLPACRDYLRDGTGQITSCEKRTLTNEFSEYEIRAYLQQRNGLSVHILDSINWTANRMPGYQLAFGNADAALRLTPARKHSTRNSTSFVPLPL
jgi:hypothetical protein